MNNASEVIISGIRHYLPGGEYDIPAFQVSHPEGSRLQLRLRARTELFPYVIQATDQTFQTVGSVAVEYVCSVRPLFGDIEEGGCIDVQIVRHLPTAIVVSVPGLDQSIKPQFSHLELLPGELAMPYTQREQLAQYAGDSLEQMLRNDPTDPQIEPSLRVYIDHCAYSICGYDMIQRRRICDLIEQQSAHLSREVRSLGYQLYEVANDFKRKGNIYKVYQAQYADVWQQVGHAYAEQCCKLLAAGTSDMSTFCQERDALQHQLDQDLDGYFTTLQSDPERLSLRLFYYAYDRRSLYILLSRMMRLEYLDAVIDEARDKDDEVVSKHPIQTKECPIGTPLDTKGSVNQRPLADGWQNTTQPLPSGDVTKRDTPETSPADAVTAFCTELSAVLQYLYEHAPSTVRVQDPQQPGVLRELTLTIRQRVLDCLCQTIQNEWQKELLEYLKTRKKEPERPYSRALVYLLLGWLRRKTTLLGQLPKKQMSQILSLQPGCPYKAKSLESYIASEAHDAYTYNNYPLMKCIRELLDVSGMDLWIG